MAMGESGTSAAVDVVACAIGMKAFQVALLATTVCWAGMVTESFAQPAVQVAQGTSQPRRIDIPAQPLSAALVRFSDITGLQLLFDPNIAKDLRSTSVADTLAPEAALQRLLTGTGLTYRFATPTTITLVELPKASSAAVLPPISVEGLRSSYDSGRTEGTHSYAGSQVTVGSKTPTTIREVPQSVSVVTRERIEDRNFTTVDQAMRETTGMIVAPNLQNAYQIRSRGYRPQYQIDGVGFDDSLGGFSNMFDLSIYDRLEVLRGPSGLFSGGATDPSGIVNFVHKRPTREFAYGGSAGIGSWNYYRGEADVAGPFSDRVRGRFVAAGQDNDTFVDVVHNERKIGYGALELDLSEATTLALGTAYQDQTGVPYAGVPAYPSGQFIDLARSTFLGADWNRHNVTGSSSYFDLEHRFDGGAAARISGRWLDRSQDGKYLASGVFNTATNTVTLDGTATDFHQEDMGLDANFSTPVNLLGREHKLLLGADYRAVDANSKRGSRPGFATSNVFNPVHDFVEPDIPFTSSTLAETEQYGTYGQARIKPIDSLTLIVGARLSWWNTKSTNLLTNIVTAKTSVEQELTPYYGAIVDITDNFSVYAAYSEIFAPQSAMTVGGDVLQPRTGSQHEAGLKAELLDKNLIGHFAVFRIQDENRAMDDPANLGFSVPAGEVRAEGFEAELSGMLLPQWNVYAGYAYTKTKFLQANPSQIGQVFDSGTPKHAFNLSTRYRFDGGALDRFSVGGGVRISSGTFFDEGGSRFRQDPYTVVSASIGYLLTDTVSAMLSVNNIFDEVYYERVRASGSFNYFGEPRSVWLTIRKSF